MKKFLQVLIIGLTLFMVIDACLYIAFDFKWIDALFKLLGVETGFRGVPSWIKIMILIAMCIFVAKYDSIFDYAFRNDDQRKYK